MKFLNYQQIEGHLLELEKINLLRFLDESKKRLDTLKFVAKETGLGYRILIFDKRNKYLADITDYKSW